MGTLEKGYPACLMCPVRDSFVPPNRTYPHALRTKLSLSALLLVAAVRPDQAAAPWDWRYGQCPSGPALDPNGPGGRGESPHGLRA